MLKKTDFVLQKYEVISISKEDITEKIKKQILDIFDINSKKDGSVLDCEALEKCEEVYFVVLVENPKKIVGYLLCGFLKNNSILEKDDTLYIEKKIEGVYIYQTAVSPEYQQNGIAKLMYASLVKKCITLSIEKIYAHVSVTNMKSLRFHCSSIHFTPIGEYVTDNFHGKLKYKSLLLESNVSNYDTKV